MHDTNDDPGAFRVLRFRPGIKGVARAYTIRAMHWQGALWLVAKDASAAAGWHPDTFRHRRTEALTGDAWGYASVPTVRGRHMMTLVQRHELAATLAGSVGVQARRFLRWLNGLGDVAVGVDTRAMKSSV